MERISVFQLGAAFDIRRSRLYDAAAGRDCLEQVAIGGRHVQNFTGAAHCGLGLAGSGGTGAYPEPVQPKIKRCFF
jgi:hypothetical protein